MSFSSKPDAIAMSYAIKSRKLQEWMDEAMTNGLSELAAAEQIHQYIRGHVEAPVDGATEEKLEPADSPASDPKHNHAELQNAGTPPDASVARASTYRISAVKVENFLGIKSVTLRELETRQVIVLMGGNGKGKSSLIQAIGRGSCSVSKKDLFLRAQKGEIDIALSPSHDTAKPPAFRSLGDSEFNSLVMPDLNAAMSGGLKDFGDALSAAAGASSLQKQSQIAERLVSAHQKGRYSIIAGKDSLRREDPSGEPPLEVTENFRLWKEAIESYRSSNGTPTDQPLRTDPEEWNAVALNLWKVIGLQDWRENNPFEELKAKSIAEQLELQINTMQPPEEWSKVTRWLQGVQGSLNYLRPRLQEAADKQQTIGASLLSAVADCADIAGLPSGQDPGQHAPIVVEALAAEAELPALSDDSDQCTAISPYDLAKRALQALRHLKEKVAKHIEALDARTASLENAKQWLERTPEADICPVCERSHERETLLELVQEYLSRPESPTKTLRDRKDRIGQAISQIDRLIREWENSDRECEDLRTKLSEALTELATPPEPLSESTRSAIRELVKAGNTYKKDITDRNNNALLEASGAILPRIREVLAEFGREADAFTGDVNRHRSELNKLRALSAVIMWDQKTCASTWANQSKQIEEDKEWNKAIGEWQQAICAFKTRIDTRHENVKSEIVENSDVIRAYKEFVTLGQHAFLDKTFDGKTPQMLSEGYRVLHALAAVFAVASITTRGNDAGFLLLDEPTKGLDPMLREKVGSFLGSNCRKQLIVATYDPIFKAALLESATAQLKAPIVYDLDWNPEQGTIAKDYKSQ